MKKITLLIAFLFAIAAPTYAQVRAYSFSQSNGTYTAITGGTVLGDTASDDQRFVDPAVPLGGTTLTGVGFPIGFNFTFNGFVYDRFAVNTNGWISLGTSSQTPSVNVNTSSSYTPLSSTSTTVTNDLVARVAGFARDLQMQAGGEMRYELLGSSPNQTLVVQWTNARKYTSSVPPINDSFNFQIRLNENGNTVEVVYGTMTNNATTGTVMSGLRANPNTPASNFNSRTTTTYWNATTASTSAGNTLSISSSIVPASGLTFTWTPPAACSGTPTAGTVSPTSQTLLAGQTPAPLVGSGYSTGVSGLAFQWEESADDVTYVNAVGGTGATTPSYTPPAFAGTTIYYRLRVTCTNSTLSAATSGVVLNPCPVLTVPSLEDFTTYVPSCWQEADNGDLVAGPATFGTSSWAADGFANNGTTGAMKVNIDATGDNDWILSPLYAIPATGYELKFNAAATQFGSQAAPTNPWEADDFVEVLVSTGTTNWTVLYTYNNTNVPSNSGSVNIIDLDAYSGQNVRFAFRGVEGATNGSADIDFSVDDFEIRMTPACPDIAGLAVNNITDVSADITWIASPGNYEYVLDQVNTDPAGSGAAITSASYNAGGLSELTTYYFHVRTVCAGPTYSAWTTVSFTTTATPLANDNLSGAIALNCNDNVTGDTSLATLDEDNAPDGFGADLDAPNVWYSYTGSGTAEVITIDMCPSSYDTSFLVYTGTSGNLTLVGGNDDGGTTNCPGAGTRSYGSFTSDGTTTYYITVEGWNSTSVGLFDLTLTCAPACSPAQTNQDCASATGLSVDGNATTVDNSCATVNATQPTCDSFNAIADVWYTFIAPASGQVNVTATLGTATAVHMAAYSGSCGTLTSVGCSSAEPLATLTLTALTAGNTYYLQLWNNGTEEGTFDVTLTDPALSVGEFENNHFTYFPNPVKNTLSLRAQNEIQNVSVFNMLGQEVIRTSPNEMSNEVDMSSLQAGAYFVKVTVNDNTETIRIIKQ